MTFRFDAALLLSIALLISGCSSLYADLEKPTYVPGNTAWQPVSRDVQRRRDGRSPDGLFYDGQPKGRRDEQPVQQVCFERPFWIDRYEVSNGQYGSEGPFSGADKPRTNLTWFEARDYCAARALGCQPRRNGNTPREDQTACSIPGATNSCPMIWSTMPISTVNCRTWAAARRVFPGLALMTWRVMPGNGSAACTVPILIRRRTGEKTPTIRPSGVSIAAESEVTSTMERAQPRAFAVCHPSVTGSSASAVRKMMGSTPGEPVTQLPPVKRSVLRTPFLMRVRRSIWREPLSGDERSHVRQVLNDLDPASAPDQSAGSHVKADLQLWSRRPEHPDVPGAGYDRRAAHVRLHADACRRLSEHPATGNDIWMGQFVRTCTTGAPTCC